MDEFDALDRLFRPLATAPEALGLRDDAALLPGRAGHELVVTTDALVEGVHFLPDDPADQVARKLLRVNLSDLAAKGAEPYGYLLTVAWPAAWDDRRRTAFAAGLAEDQAAFGLSLFGGDTVSTPGPMLASATLFGWVPAGRMAPRAGARPGDVLLVSGTIGDGGLGLRAARGALTDAPPDAVAWLADRYRLPQPRIALGPTLRAYASAAADVSDGLLADARHIAEASGVALEIALDRLPLSPAAQACGADRLELATAGDDYEVVCAAPPDRVAAAVAAAAAAGIALTVIGRAAAGAGLRVTLDGQAVAIDRLGWRHG